MDLPCDTIIPAPYVADTPDQGSNSGVCVVQSPVQQSDADAFVPETAVQRFDDTKRLSDLAKNEAAEKADLQWIERNARLALAVLPYQTASELEAAQKGSEAMLKLILPQRKVGSDYLKGWDELWKR
ncbi:unnamed protein product [Cuscuta epithymum]|uniref:Uncharacterized protein n=1 Tax=Cuscuta epithymum TaxID=186058 RepID=A0AAV0F7U4_9ASTE|nr:unnamed protein product [Cuscuta epithymum]CAH9131617.1 unnamed protein product [Cuscuta epithymum]